MAADVPCTEANMLELGQGLVTGNVHESGPCPSGSKHRHTYTHMETIVHKHLHCICRQKESGIDLSCIALPCVLTIEV